MPSTYQKNRHDIGLTDPGTDGTGTNLYGLMLRKIRGVPVYSELDGRYLADQFFTGTPSQTYINPEEELPLGQSDWRSGFGLEVMDANDPLRYFSSIGMDMRFRGMAIAGQKATSITKPADLVAPTITNSDMELTTGWTNGSRSDSQAHGGTYSWSVDNGVEAHQDVDSTADYSNRELVFSCWAKTGGANAARLKLDDGVGETAGSWHSTSGNWEQLSVTRTFNQNSTRVRLILDSDAADVYFDDASITVTAITEGVPAHFAEFNDKLYIASGTHLAKLNAAGDGFALVETMGATITDLETMVISGTEYLFIALGTSTDYKYMIANETTTTSDATVKRFNFFKVVHAAAPTMWGSDGDNTIRSTTNPLNSGSAWSGQTVVDTNSYAITGLNTKTGALYIPKEDTVYYLDSSGNVQDDLAPELVVLTKSTDNGKNAFLWLNKWYFAYGKQSLLENDGATNTWRNPADYATNLSDFTGQVFAVTGDDRYLFAIVDNSTKVEVLAGRLETIGSTTSWVWHPINETTLTGCELAFVSSITQKRLYFSSSTASENMYYIPLPLGYGDVVNDANRDFQTNTELHFSWMHGGFKSTDKAFYKVEATLGHTHDTGIYFECWYKKLGDTEWTDAGDLVGTSTERSPTLFIPDDDEDNHPISKMMQFKVIAKTDDVTKTPILLSFNVTALLYPVRKQVISCQIVCAENISTKTVEDKSMYDKIVTLMNNAKNATFPISARDIDGNTINVKLLPLSGGTPRFEIVRDEKGREKERYYNLRLQVVPLE